MNITLNLSPEAEAGLLAQARQRGVSLDTLLKEMVEVQAGSLVEGTSSRRHISEVILERMSKVPAEISAAMPADGASQHDHYIHGLPKREE